MIIMTKLEKRLRKLEKNVDNALIIGSAFGNLEATLSTFNTVFVISTKPRILKAKNLVYKENFEGIEHLGGISMVLIDLDHLTSIEPMQPFFNKNFPLILVEGNDVISRKYSGIFYDRGWRAVEQSKIFHVWKKLH